MNKRVLLGISGGIDSAVAAILLKERGYDVIGATMSLFNQTDKGNKSFLSNNCYIDDAKQICELLKIPHYTLAFEKEFKKRVINNFIEEYSKCRTPNPCIECNKYLKFGLMKKTADELNADYIATGHYAKVEYSNKYKRYVLKKSNNIEKDQSYVLYNIPKELLEKVIFPLGEFNTKQEIKKIAKEYNLNIINKPESEDICFIPDKDYKRYLLNNSKLKPNIGNIVNSKGEILGQHNGLYNFTIGQRRGIKISYKKPLFVIGFNKDKNELIVGEYNKLYKKEMLVKDVNLLLVDNIDTPINVMVKTRYSSKEAEAIIEKTSAGYIKVVFKKPALNITPGQSAVFYIDDIVLGGGKII